MAAALALMAGGSMLSAVGQVQAARQQRLQAEFSAKMKREQADEMVKRTAYNIREMLREQRALTGSQVGAFAKGGVEISGSAMNVIEDTVFRFEERVRGMKLQNDWEVTRLRRVADAEIAAGKAAESIGYYGAAGTLLTGAGNVGVAGYRMGMFGGGGGGNGAGGGGGIPGYGGSHGSLN